MMEWDYMFILNSILLGIGLATDAFSVSLVNGLSEPEMRKSKLLSVAGVFAAFQFIMPMLGWLCVHKAIEYISAFEMYIPWISLILLTIIGGEMLLDGVKKKKEQTGEAAVGFIGLIMQGIATSIDALSVGLTVAEYEAEMALSCSVIIGVITFFICSAGLNLGRKFGTKLSGKASVFGGLILIAIGVEVFFKGIM